MAETTMAGATDKLIQEVGGDGAVAEVKAPSKKVAVEQSELVKVGEHMQALEQENAQLRAKQPAPEPVAQEPVIIEKKVEAEKPAKKTPEAFSLKKIGEKWKAGIGKFISSEPVKMGLKVGAIAGLAMLWNPVLTPLFATLALKYPILGTIAGSVGGFIHKVPEVAKFGLKQAQTIAGGLVAP